MGINFRNIILSLSTLFLMLSFALLFMPEIIYWLFSLQQNNLGNFLAKRAGVLFLGFSMLCFLTSNSVNQELRNTVSLVVGTTMSLMAIIGTYELARGFTGMGMLVAIVTEVFIAAIFLSLWIRNPVKSVN